MFHHLRKLLNTHTYTEDIMATKTISISEEAYEKLKGLKASEKESFSDVILKYYPKKRKLSEVLAKIGSNPELANAIEKASMDMREANMREVDLDAGA
jgi:predicted CopG family antitoxin